MPRRSATPVRFDEDVADRLAAFAASHPGLSLSGAANLLVDEGLRMVEHPGVVFRDGPSGRRAGLVGGPDVWEVVRAVKSARTTSPRLTESKVLDVVSENTDLRLEMLHIAINYWSTYPVDVDAEIAAADRAEAVAEAAWQRRQRLLAR